MSTVMHAHKVEVPWWFSAHVLQDCGGGMCDMGLCCENSVAKINIPPSLPPSLPVSPSCSADSQDTETQVLLFSQVLPTSLQS